MLPHVFVSFCSANLQVQRVVVLNPSLPSDGAFYIRLQCNRLVSTGSTTSFAERIELTPLVAEQWLIEWERIKGGKKTKEGTGEEEDDDEDAAPGDDATATKKRSQAGYEKAYGEFIKRNYSDCFAGFEDYKRAALFRKKTLSLGIYKRLQEFEGTDS